VRRRLEVIVTSSSGVVGESVGSRIGGGRCIGRNGSVGSNIGRSWFGGVGGVVSIVVVGEGVVGRSCRRFGGVGGVASIVGVGEGVVGRSCRSCFGGVGGVVGSSSVVSLCRGEKRA